MPKNDWYPRRYRAPDEAPDEWWIRQLPQPQDPTPEQQKVFAKLKETMWKKHKVSWGLERIKDSSEGWRVTHSPAEFFTAALANGEIDQESHDGFKKRYGYLWTDMDLVR